MMYDDTDNGRGLDSETTWGLWEVSDAPDTFSDLAEDIAPETLHQIWAQRAAQFAQALEEEDTGEQIDLILVRLGEGLYGLEARHVFRIRHASQVEPVPGVPAWIAGVVNERGHILSVFDLHHFFSLPLDSNADDFTQPVLIFVDTPDMELALLVDEVLTVESLPLSRVQPAPESLKDLPSEYVQGIVRHTVESELDETDEEELLMILDIRALLADETIVVYQESV